MARSRRKCLRCGRRLGQDKYRRQCFAEVGEVMESFREKNLIVITEGPHSAANPAKGETE